MGTERNQIENKQVWEKTSSMVISNSLPCQKYAQVWVGAEELSNTLQMEQHGQYSRMDYGPKATTSWVLLKHKLGCYWNGQITIQSKYFKYLSQLFY